MADDVIVKFSVDDQGVLDHRKELNKIQNLIDSANRAQMQVGTIEVQKNNILNQISIIQNQIASFRNEVRKNYGTDDIDIQTGEINYNKDEQTNKKD